MVDFIVDGLRINWAGKGAPRFYEGPANGHAAPDEPTGFGPPKVAAQFDSTKEGTSEDVSAAARQLIDAIAIMHGRIMSCADDARMGFADGSSLLGVQLKSLWQSARFIVNNEKDGEGRGGKTLIEAQESHIRFSTVSGYAAHGPAQLNFIILHELMHMTAACTAAFEQDWSRYLLRNGIGDPAGMTIKEQQQRNERIVILGTAYGIDDIEFRRTEQFTHLATRAAMDMVGLVLFAEMHPEPPKQQTLDNMPPFGFVIEG